MSTNSNPLIINGSGFRFNICIVIEILSHARQCDCVVGETSTIHTAQSVTVLNDVHQACDSQVVSNPHMKINLCSIADSGFNEVACAPIIYRIEARTPNPEAGNLVRQVKPGI